MMVTIILMMMMMVVVVVMTSNNLLIHGDNSRPLCARRINNLNHNLPYPIPSQPSLSTRYNEKICTLSSARQSSSPL